MSEPAGRDFQLDLDDIEIGPITEIRFPTMRHAPIWIGYDPGEIESRQTSPTSTAEMVTSIARMQPLRRPSRISAPP